MLSRTRVGQSGGCTLTMHNHDIIIALCTLASRKSFRKSSCLSFLMARLCLGITLLLNSMYATRSSSATYCDQGRIVAKPQATYNTATYNTAIYSALHTPAIECEPLNALLACWPPSMPHPFHALHTSSNGGPPCPIHVRPPCPNPWRANLTMCIRHLTMCIRPCSDAPHLAACSCVPMGTTSSLPLPLPWCLGEDHLKVLFGAFEPPLGIRARLRIGAQD